jgi:sugar O-acyltransferase (sialic acid O-acetyltransferase NeuD family)
VQAAKKSKAAAGVSARRRSRPRSLAIFGAGASGREVAWLARECWGSGLALTFIVDQADLPLAPQNGIRVVRLTDFARKNAATPVVVAVGNPHAREECARKCVAAGLGFAPPLAHPRVEASRWLTIGVGSIVCAGSVLTTNIGIGEHVHINVGCTVSHDARLGDFATLSPGVHISGWVTIGRGAFLGTGAVVSNGSSDRPIVIGENAVVGAGACVIRDVPAGATVVGVPAVREL